MVTPRRRPQEIGNLVHVAQLNHLEEVVQPAIRTVIDLLRDRTILCATEASVENGVRILHARAILKRVDPMLMRASELQVEIPERNRPAHLLVPVAPVPLVVPQEFTLVVQVGVPVRINPRQHLERRGRRALLVRRGRELGSRVLERPTRHPGQRGRRMQCRIHRQSAGIHGVLAFIVREWPGPGRRNRRSRHFPPGSVAHCS